MRAPAWLTARPVAHRGLHDRARGIVENMPGAMHAAIAGRFSIECDVQLSGDGEAMVHHDDDLGRLTDGTGPLRSKTAAELRQVAFKDTAERMMTLADLCALVDGRVGLVIEIKSHFDGDHGLVRRTADILRSYKGPAAWMSFDPEQVVAMRRIAPEIPRGITAQRSYDDGEWTALTEAQRAGMRHLRHAFRTRPHFVSYWVRELPAPAPWIARNLFGCALLCWTVRTPQQRAVSERWADQMTFEGFVP
jgi:glycerophosphoryl diester phosphodiesterase